ncbi:MAG: phosphoribosylformimino-5-aminoimidazole carboxamide ribotide isomerase [Lachnospiraceae bacterium]|nr:phosphoribosylformimino-5-aminoimidazole carboxamide ribotide isomerase [Lachnospiraceae bacterium]
MRFRPCIDIHNGRVKQIVGGSLRDSYGASAQEEKPQQLKENFVSDRDAAYYAGLYRQKGLSGGHVIMLDHKGSGYYEASREQALSALGSYPGGLMAGGGIEPSNAAGYLDAGASHVIVTSYVFRDGRVDYDALKRMREAVGRERLCLDLSCRRREGAYYIVTDRWQRFTEERLDDAVMELLSGYAAEYLVHAVDSEGKQQGIDEEIISILGRSPVPATYAGGVGSLDDIKRIRTLGGGRVDVTVGSALDIFGGNIGIEEIIACIS